MAKSRIEITFTGVPGNSDVLDFNTISATATGIKETFVTLRQSNYQSTRGASNTQAAANYAQALSLDYGPTGLYNIYVAANVVTIYSNLPNTIFYLQSYVGTAWRTYTIFNETEVVPISIQQINYLANLTNVCGKVNVEVKTNGLATEYTTDGVTYTNTFNPFTYELLRGITSSLSVKDSGGNTASLSLKTPAALSAGNVTVVISNTPGGASISVQIFDTYALNLEYSLDSSIWKEDNTFTGLANGNYTAYVRDQFGCIVNNDFTVNVFTPDVKTVCPTSYISESMSIRFKHNEVWDFFDVYKNDFNTLSCEEDVLSPFMYKQLFKPSNVVTTQLLSNYQDIAVNIIREDNTKVSVPLDVKYKFVDMKDRRDAAAKKLDATKAGVYYISGDTYDPTTGVQNGTYALNGALPDYASVGNYIQIDGFGWFLIEDIRYDEAVNADMIVITHTPAAATVDYIVSSNWNQKNFNVNEFTIDFAPYVNEYLQVEILQSSPGFGDFNYLSEVIEVRKTFKDSIEMIWQNFEDSNVFYSTGIKNIGNFYFSYFKSGNDSELVINKTTNTSIMVMASNYDTKELVIEDISTAIMKQIIQASLHKSLLINRIPYLASATPSVENVDNSNIYKATLPLVQTNPPYLACQPGGQPSPSAYPSPVS